MRTRPQQCFDTELSGVEVRRPEALRASVSGTTIFIHAHTGISLLYGRLSTNGENFKAFRREIKKL